VRTRVAFTLIGGKSWTGGHNYLLNLLQVLAEKTPEAITPVLFLGEEIPEAEIAPFLAISGCEIVRNSVFDENARNKISLRGMLLGRDRAVHQLLQAAKVNVVFESTLYFGWRLPIPAIAWIPDLQHLYLPQLFGRSAWWRREIGFRVQIASGRTIMSSSKDTRQACERAYPRSRGRVHAVRFAVPAVDLPFTHEAARAIADRYNLPESFFFMPNQFWVHKNHQLVVSALDLLRKQGKTIYVVATGKQLDPRNPKYAESLIAEVKSMGLEKQFITPGLLPYADLMPLMQASVALLNPSLFEGWSTTVEEARAAGVPMLLSDLAVHHEQAADKASYFDRTSAASLADALGNFQPSPADVRHAQRVAAQQATNERISRFANDFVHLIHRVIEEKNVA
jgi:glycosyltransferase involved in cell wall biosynthesis